MAYSKEVRDSVLEMRVKDRKSLKKISEETGISKGTLSVWLKDHRLTDKEIKERIADRDAKIGLKLKKGRGPESEYHQVANVWQMSSIQKAKVAEAAVLFRLLLHGFSVFGSPFDGDRSDWVVEGKDGNFLKIQVKYVYDGAKGLPLVSLKRSGMVKAGRPRYQKGDFDFIVGYDLFSDTAYVFSWDETSHLRNSVTVRDDAAEAWEKLNPT